METMIPDPKPRIVVVDDHAMVTEMITATIGKQYEVSTFNTGKSIVERIEKIRPHLILLDILLGDHDGCDICRRLKQLPETREIPVVFLSSLTDTFDKVKAFEAGGVDYVTKRRFPLLGHILPFLFSRQITTRTNYEVFVLLTPRVIDLEPQELDGRLRGFLNQQEGTP